MNCDVSVIIPNYNKGRFVRNTIASVLNQSNSSLEIIIIDDASTDNSLEVIKAECEADDRCSIIELKNCHGGSYCRNKGLEEAKGTYVVFLDSDDILAPHCLAQRVKAMQGTQLDFAVFPMQTFEHDIREGGAVWNPKVTNPLEKFLSHELPWQTMQPIFKRSFVEQLGGYNPDYERMQDVEFHTRALLATDQFILHTGNPDCFLRVSQQRFTFSAENYLQRFFRSAVKYYNEFYSSENRRQLTCTLIEVMAVAQHYRLNGKIETEQLKRLAAQTKFKDVAKADFRSKWYWNWALSGKVHIPGLKRLTKMFIKAI